MTIGMTTTILYFYTILILRRAVFTERRVLPSRSSVAFRDICLFCEEYDCSVASATIVLRVNFINKLGDIYNPSRLSSDSVFSDSPRVQCSAAITNRATTSDTV